MHAKLKEIACGPAQKRFSVRCDPACLDAFESEAPALAAFSDDGNAGCELIGWHEDLNSWPSPAAVGQHHAVHRRRFLERLAHGVDSKRHAIQRTKKPLSSDNEMEKVPVCVTADAPQLT